MEVSTCLPFFVPQSCDEKHAGILLLVYQNLNRQVPVLSHLNRTSISAIRLEYESGDDRGVYGAGNRKPGPIYVGFDGLTGLEVGD